VVGLRRALLLGHHQLLALLLEQLQLQLLVLVQEVQALEVLAALLLLLELVLVEQLRPGAARRPGLLEVRPPVVLDLVVRPPRQAPRDRRPPARVKTTRVPIRSIPVRRRPPSEPNTMEREEIANSVARGI